MFPQPTSTQIYPLSPSPTPGHPPFLPMEEDISTNVSVVRALGGPCGDWWLAIDCSSLFGSKEPPCLPFLSTSQPPLSDTDLGGAAATVPQ